MSDALFITKNDGFIRETDIADAYASVGIEAGDIVMVHARLFTLGRMVQDLAKEQLANAFIDTLLRIVGKEGCVIFPTFTLSVCKTGFFDLKNTKSEMGLLSEHARTRPDSMRTPHPLFSVSVLGEQKYLFHSMNLSTCFGNNSFFDRLHQLNHSDATKGKVKFITLGIDQPPEAITYIHSIEEKMAVPYRYQKDFRGNTHTETGESAYDVNFFVRDLSTDVIFDAEACWNVLKDNPTVKTQPLGNSFIAMLPEATIFYTLTHEINSRYDFLCKGGYPKLGQ